MALPHIQNTSDIRIGAIKVLTYGPTNAGKTFLCSTAPNPLVLSVESGLLSLSSKNLPYMEIQNYTQMMEIHAWLLSSQEARKAFQTICLDSLTEIMEVLLTHEKSINKDGRQAYGALLDNGMALVRMFRNLPFNVYMSAQMEYVKDDVQGGVKYGPSMPGSKLSQKLPYQFDEVFKADVGVDKSGNRYHYLLTQSDLQNTAKDRSGKLASIEYPDLTAIFTKIAS